MDRDAARAHCLAQPGAWQDQPFGEDSLVFKVAHRMFALIPVNGPAYITLKCDPNWAQLLRDTYPAVTGAYYFNKRHWNAVALDGSVPADEIAEMIVHSYELVVKGLPRKDRERLAGESRQ